MQLQRLFEITYILLQRKRVTAKELAEHFEVSTRTIYRDLDALSMSGIPLYTNKGNQGGIFLMEDYTLSKSILSDEEQQHLLSALQSYQSANRFEVTNLLTKLSGQFQKEQIDWISVDFNDWSGNKKNSEYFAILKEAILKHKVVSFTYYDSYGNCKERHVEPFRLLFKGQSWYLIAYCLDKQAQRMFKLYRMENMRLEKQESTHFIQEEELASVFHQAQDEMVEIEAIVHPKFAFRVFDEYLPQHYKKLENGFLKVQIAFPKGEWIYSYLMGFEDGLVVEKPLWLKAELQKRFHQAIKNYEDTNHESF